MSVLKETHTSQTLETLLYDMLAQANQQIGTHLSAIAQLEADNTDLLAEVMDNDHLEKWFEAKLAMATARISQLQKETVG